MTLSKKEYLEYVEGDISANRKQEIDQFLQDNPLERKSLEAAIKYNGVNSFEDLVDLLEEQVNQQVASVPSQVVDAVPVPKKVFRLWPYIASAAAAVLILLFVLPSLSNSKIRTASYFDAYPDVVSSTVRGDQKTAESLTYLAMTAYNKGDYPSAVKLFDNIVKENSIDKRLPFYQAVSMVGAGNYKAALPILQELSSDPGFPYMDGVIWNLALCQIELGQKADAKNTLELVIANNVYKKKEAQELLSLLL